MKGLALGAQTLNSCVAKGGRWVLGTDSDRLVDVILEDYENYLLVK